MKLIDAYKLAVNAGIDNDPRSRDEIDRILEDSKKSYDSLSDEKKEYFDMEKLWNPYADSRFTSGDENVEVDTILWGIDIGTGEILLADRLKEKGISISAVAAHHPNGLSRTPFPEVMWMQTEMYNQAGIPINVAEGIMKPRMDEVSRNVMGSNYNQAADAAKLLDIPFFNLHTVADNMVQKYLEKAMEELNPKYVGDIIERLLQEPEMKAAAKQNNPPCIIVGNKKARCGKVIVKMTGGTSGPKNLYEQLAHAGVGTVIGMHFPESHIEEAKKYNINLVISGHMPSDSLGINLIADIWEKEGITVLPCSGLIRVSRN